MPRSPPPTSSETHLRRSRRTTAALLATGQPKLDAYLDDYATLANALVSLYEASFDETWLDWACDLVEFVLQTSVMYRGRLVLHRALPRND